MIILSDILTQYRPAVNSGNTLFHARDTRGSYETDKRNFPRKNHRPFRDDDFLFSLPAFKECLVRQVRFVSVRLGQQVAGSVHGQHGRAAVHHFRAPVRHHESNCSAAALVDFSQLADLPAYTGIIKDFSDLLQKFRIGIIAA